MFRFHIILLFFLFSSICIGQERPVQIMVKGSCSSTPEKIGQKVELTVTVNKNKCDPEKGFFNMEETLVILSDALKKEGIDFSDFQRSFESRKSKIEDVEIYSYVDKDEEIKKVMKVAKRLDIPITSLRDEYKPKTLEEQDEHAICALQDAQRRAAFIAEKLGYKNCVLRAVDDDTQGSLSISVEYILNTMSREEFLSGASVYTIFGYFDMY